MTPVMPEPPDAQLRRDRRSSSVLLNAFRVLTSSRKPPNQSPPLSAGGSSSSTQDPSVTETISSDSKTLEANGVSEMTISPAEESKRMDPVLKASDVAGGPPELARLLIQLQADQPLAVRSQAVYKVCRYLERHTATEVLAIWMLGNDLLTNESPDAAQYGFELLMSCIKASQLTTAERKFYWDSIHTCTRTDHLEMRLVATMQLSDNGRQIECMEGKIATYLSALLKEAYVAAVLARKKHPRGAVDVTIANEDILKRIFNFTTNVIKCNSTILKNSDYEALIARLLSICTTTNAAHDLANSLDIISHLATYTNISARAFRPCLDLLCGIYKQVPTLKEATWAVWKRIFESNLKSSAVVYLFSILREASKLEKKEMTVQGAFGLLSDLALNDGKDGMPKVELSTFAPAVNTLLQSGTNFKLEMDVLRFYNVILAEPTLRSRLIDDVDWMYLRESVSRCSNLLQDKDHSEDSTTLENSPLTPSKKVFTTSTMQAANLLNDIVQYLCDCFQELNIIHQEEAATLFLHLGGSLSDNAATVLLNYFASRPFLTSRPLEDYQRIWRHLILYYAQDTKRSVSLRLQAYQHLSGRFDEVQYMPVSIVEDFVLLLIQDLDKEHDIEVLEVIAAFIATVLRSDHGGLLFDRVINKVRTAIFYRQDLASPTRSRRPSTSPASFVSSAPAISHCRIVVRHIIRLFLELINESAEHAEELYQLIIDVAGEGTLEADARICALKLLFRLRSTEDNRLYVAAFSESESIAEVLCRTVETAAKITFNDVLEPTKETRSISMGSVPTLRPKPVSVKKAIPPLWFYPGPKALPSEPPKEPSLILFVGPPPVMMAHRKVIVLKIALWLEMVLTILQQPNINWEVYSYVLVHLGSQLKNQTFFSMAIPHIKMLRNVICDQLRAQTFLEPPSHTSLRKADVAVCLYHSLTMLVNYNAHFAKSEEDELVRTFLLGIAFWEGTSKWCIHALSVCCHELPSSVRKSLDNIIQKMSTIITRPGIAIHILEFLCGVARLPDMHQNFTDEEYRMVFGVAFKYLQFVQDQQQRKQTTVQRGSGINRGKRLGEATRDLKQQTSDSNLRAKLMHGEDLPQYVHALAYHVITFWFMALKLRDRPQHVQQIVKNLTHRDISGNNAIEEQGLVTLDMMERVAYTDRDETIAQPDFASASDGDISEKTWIVGLSLLTIQTAGRTGISQIIRRRPSGTHYSIYRPAVTSPPRHQVPITNGLEADAFYTSSYTGVLPESVLQDLYAPLSLASAPQPLREVPFILPDNDDKVRRALASFDRNSTVDGHKIGVIYIAQDQKEEKQILANTYGSPAYTDFVDALGTLVRLRDAQFNTGGLDKTDNSDGMYAYCWRDRSTEVVWHVTTMMPTNLEDDAQCINKKRHIGNDYVNIVWNDSGEPFNFDTFPSQFNYVYIVITPEPTASFSSQRPRIDEQVVHETAVSRSPVTAAFDHHPPSLLTPSLHYRVQVMSAPGFPSISPAAETKMISAHGLAPFVRLLALNASFFSLVWAERDGGEIISPWRNRLREIIRLRERYGVTSAANESLSSFASNAAHNAATPGAGRGGSSPITGPVTTSTGGSSSNTTGAIGLIGNAGAVRSAAPRGPFGTE